VGGAVEGYEGGLGKVDPGQATTGVGWSEEVGGLLGRDRTVHLMASIVCLEAQP